MIFGNYLITKIVCKNVKYLECLKWTTDFLVKIKEMLRFLCTLYLTVSGIIIPSFKSFIKCLNNRYVLYQRYPEELHILCSY